MWGLIFIAIVTPTIALSQLDLCKAKLDECWKKLAYCKCSNDLTTANNAANQAGSNVKDLQKKIDDLKIANDALKNGFSAKDKQISDLQTKSSGLDATILQLQGDLKKASTYADDCRKSTILLSVNDLNAQRKFTTTDTVACEGTQATLECLSSKFVKPIKSNYGRLDHNTCSIDAYTNNCVGSSNDNTIVTAKCNGLSTCVVPASNAVFSDPCPTVGKNLNSIYYCSDTI